MGGKGSGRLTREETIVREQGLFNSVNPNVVNTQNPLVLPNLSGVKESALKTSVLSSENEWTELTGQIQGTLEVNHNYLMNAATQISVSLPANCDVGDRIIMLGKGAGGWRMKPTGDQQILLKDQVSATGTNGGYIESGYKTDSVEVVCTTKDTIWTVLNCKALTNLGIQLAWVNTKSVLFDGVDEYYRAANNTILQIGANDATLSAWVKLGDTTGTQFIMGKGTLQFKEEGYGMYASGTSFGCQLRDSSNAAVGAGTDTTISSGTWYHVCMTIDRDSATGLKLYINGSAEANTGDPTALNADLDGTSVFSIATRHGEGGSLFPLNGNIDEVSIFNKSFSQAEIDEIYNSGSPNNVSEHSANANLISYWRMGDDVDDDETTIIDQETTSNDLTGVNMEVADVQSTDVP